MKPTQQPAIRRPHHTAPPAARRLVPLLTPLPTSAARPIALFATLSTSAVARLIALFATLSTSAAVALALPPPATAAPPGADPSAVWPLTPRPAIVRGFELPAKPWLPGHRGLDLSGSPGQPVLSATAGTITYAGPLAGRGVVVVTNGPLRTTYEPVIPTTHLGATVAPGDQLGTLSSAGTHCPPRTCLHWGLRRGPTYLNPLTLLTTRPVRLLPLTPRATATNTHSLHAYALTPSSPEATHPASSDPPTPDTANPSRRRPSTQPTAAPAHSYPPPQLTAIPPAVNPVLANPSHDRGTGSVSAAVVGISAALTLAAGLLIRRH
ncbi:M23 family metallopeptidase [Kribbella monticola]|uniref:M23 family metallopeptidase n=1 Tax=Kribbella monticola TaxID=2185285 RepID=UPI000DD35D56|nr:peptidoglycan DD-metalloendopeptidase family protein [Kribbella monticola]